MKRIKENLSEQGILFSNHYVGDRLANDDEVYLFKNMIDKLDISEITNSYSLEGGSMFSPHDQLSVLCYAFFNGITSSVKIADCVRHDLRFIYLAGGHLIKRRTICDFRLKHAETIKKIFESSIQLAIEAGLVNNEMLFALDGSKIEAHASFSKTRSKGEWKERQQKIIDHIDEYMREWEEQDALEENLEEKRKKEFERIKEKLDNIKKTKKDNDKTPPQAPPASGGSSGKTESKAIRMKNKIKIEEPKDAYKYLSEHEAIETLLREYSLVNDDMFLSITDQDCRIMKSDGTTKECYNAQVISNNQVIVAADVTQDENDQPQLKPMIEQLKNNIKGIGNGVTFAADAGYNRGKNLAYIDTEEGIDAYISMYDRSKQLDSCTFYKEDFTYDEDDDSWICPTGKRLDFIKEYINKRKKYTQYGCTTENCIFCPHNVDCIQTKADKKRGYRTLDDDGYALYRKEMHDKMKLHDAKTIYSKRAGSVEPVFGQIKQNRGFTRFRLKGLRKVKAEFLIMAIAHNLGKIMKYGVFNNAI